MKRYNCIIVYHHAIDRVLVCNRTKEPYNGKRNFVGGKVEEYDASSMTAAYRELHEETGITSDLIDLKHIMDFTYYDSGIILECFAGKLKGSVELAESEHPLEWVHSEWYYFNDIDWYAGECNMAHMLLNVKLP
jgi:8-oxo-dGTP diphosphatase